MKKIIISVLAVVFGIIIVNNLFYKSNKAKVTVNDLELKIYYSRYHDLVNAGYELVSSDDSYHFVNEDNVNLYTEFNTSGVGKYEEKEDAFLEYLSVEIDDNIKKLHLDDVDVLKLTKDDVHKRLIKNKNNDYCIETNDYIKFIYKEANFVYLGFKDNKVDSFAILYDTNGARHLRDVNHISE